MNFRKEPPYNGNWSYNVLTYPTAEVTREAYNSALKQAAESFKDKGFMKKLILVSGENLNYILDDLEEQLKEKNIPENRRLSIESMLKTFSSEKGSIEYIYIMHFGLPFTEDPKVAYANMQKVRNGYEKLLNEMYIGTVLIKDESDILQIIDGMLTGEMYFGARLNGGKLIHVNKPKNYINVKDQPVSFLACADSIESDPSGDYLIINNKTIASSIIVGRYNQNISFQPSIKDDFNIWSIDELINIAKKENTAVVWCHVEIPIAEEETNSLLGERKRQSEQTKIKNKNSDMNSQNAAYNEEAEKKLDKNIEAVTKGERYVYFALIGIVLGRSVENVDAVLDEIEAKLKHGGLNGRRPKRGHLYALRMCLPTNFIRKEFLQKVSISASVALMPLRDNSALDESEGPIFCRDALTKKPIRIYPSLKNPDNTLVISPTGNGKTVVACEWAGRVIDHGDKAYFIGPKNENRNIGETRGTDYKTFVEVKNGELIEFGRDKTAPGLFVIPFDKKMFGEKADAYQMSADIHYDYVESEFGALFGEALPAGQKAKLSTALKQLYEKHGIIYNGRVKNYLDWDNGKKIVWPWINEARDIWNSHRNKKGIIIDASERALYEKTAKLASGMPYGWFGDANKRIQTEKDLVYFDLSMLPEHLYRAYCVYLTEYLNLSYLPKDPTVKVQRVYTFWDEIHSLVNDEVTWNAIDKDASKNRAEYRTSIFLTQDPSIPKEKLERLLANCRNTYLLCNLNPLNIEPVMKAFHVDERYRAKLMRIGYEIGLLFRDGRVRDVELKITDFEKKHLLGIDEGTKEYSINKMLTGSDRVVTFEVEECLHGLLQVEGFFNEDDVINGIRDDYGPLGYTQYKIQNPLAKGPEYCWIRTKLIKKADKPGNDDIIGPEGQKGVEGHRHYGGCCLIYAWMQRTKAFPNLKLNHTGIPDITWGETDEAGNLIDPENSGCIEFEILDSHGLKGWNVKVKNAQASGYKEIIFVGDTEVCRAMNKAKPPAGSEEINLVKPYICPQGKTLLRKLEEIVTTLNNRVTVNQNQLEVVMEQTGALETLL